MTYKFRDVSSIKELIIKAMVLHIPRNKKRFLLRKRLKIIRLQVPSLGGGGVINYSTSAALPASAVLLLRPAQLV
jgi:hypothetical protein